MQYINLNVAGRVVHVLTKAGLPSCGWKQYNNLQFKLTDLVSSQTPQICWLMKHMNFLSYSLRVIFAEHLKVCL